MAFPTQVCNTISVRLDETNYPTWVFHMQHHLRGHGLLKFVDGSHPCPSQFLVEDDGSLTNNSAAREKWMEQDSALISMLINTLSPEALTLVTGCSSSMEVWLILKQRYATVSEAHVMQLKSTLQNIQKGSDSIEKYLLKFKTVRDQLAVLGVKMSDQDVKVLILAGLPSEYGHTRQIIRGKNNIDLEEVRSLLLSAESEIELENKSSPLIQLTALLSQTVAAASTTVPAQNDKPNPLVQLTALLAQSVLGNTNAMQGMNCNNAAASTTTTHMNAYTGPVNSASQTGFMVPPSNGTPQSGFLANNGGMQGNNTTQHSQGFSQNNGYNNNGGSYSDNQGSYPQFPAQRNFSNNNNNNQRYSRGNNPNQNYNSPLICQICDKPGHGAWKCHQRNPQTQNDGSSSTIECQICKKPGHIAKTCKYRIPNNSNNHTGSSAMVACAESNHEVWLVDSGATNHMTSDLQNLQNVSSYNSNDGVQIECDKVTGNILYDGLCDQGLYPIPVYVASKLLPASKPSAFLGNKVSHSIWHKRLGHPSNVVVSSMLSKAHISVEPDKCTSLCESCLSGKFTKLPFSLSSEKSSIPFEIIHSDLWGPSPSMSFEGFKYYFTLIDECTRYTWIFPLRNKREAFPLFQVFCAFIANQYSASVKVLQTDGGGEYTSHIFKEFLAKNGISHQLSCPYTPQQNGLAERKNRHIVETALTLLNNASLPPRFWYHACAISVYLINRMPCTTLSMKSPFELLFKKLPPIDHIRVFGCTCYPLLKPYNSNKLQPKTAPCIFIGFAIGYKGFICYSPVSQKSIISRHVIFDESKFYFKSIPTHSQSNVNHTNTQSLPCSMSTPLHTNLVTQSPSVQLPHLVLHPSPPATCTTTSDTSIPESSSSSTNIDHIPTDNTIDCTPASIPMHDTIVPVEFIDTPYIPISDIVLDINPPSPDSHNRMINFLPPSNLTVNDHPMMTRSKNGIYKKKVFYAANIAATVSANEEPTSHKQAMKIPEWKHAMQDEYDALLNQGTWILVPPQQQKNIVSCKWVFKLKKNADGTIARHKARLVARGFSQEEGTDYDETFSPVVRHTTVRLFLALAAQYQWRLYQMDVKNAFLHGVLKEEIYMAQPPGFENPSCPTHVCKLIKSLYGLKQAPRAWNERFTSFLPSIGFKGSYSDPSLFIKSSAQGMVYLLLYVDDIILTGSNESEIHSVKMALQLEFEMKDLGLLHYFLGLQIDYLPSGGIFVSQSKYADDILLKAGMIGSKVCSTPCLPYAKLLRDEGPPYADVTHYRSLVGCLQYLTFTRPDLAYSVNTVCQFMQNPTEAHYAAVKRILRYLLGTTNYGLTYRSAPFELRAFSDADWAGDPNDRRSTTGFVIYIGNCPISWCSKKQHSVSRSSTEAEYRAMADTASEIFWLRHLLADISIPLPYAPVLHCDNVSALALASNPVHKSKCKHVEVDVHFTREKVMRGELTLQFVPSLDQFADIFTKGLSTAQFKHLCCNLVLGAPTTSLRGDDKVKNVAHQGLHNQGLDYTVQEQISSQPIEGSGSDLS
ncbi:putative RNA-directed DNA polymerase [Rosa chinensis]|uniref:Putative RNA-directed DNA polymerase n=1 Tax=Rosa chinensis TaxID=74649 RepID=A0A2P6RRZ9_ROSCH|nr:putative RNA-directed DNA polymerase [Rosa chinensis]